MSADPTGYDALIQFLYQAPIGLLQTGMDGEIAMINPMAASLLMPLAADGNLTNLFDVLLPFAPGLRQEAAAHDRPGELIGGGVIRILLHPALIQRRAPMTLGIGLVKLNDATLMATVTDVSLAVQEEQQRLDARLRDQSRTDSLTLLPNRLVALEQIEAALARSRGGTAEPVAVLFINGDRFSRINVTLGPAAGDDLLQQMAARLTALADSGHPPGTASPPRLSPARLGSDEFVAVVEGSTQGGAIHATAQRVVDALGQPYRVGTHRLHMSSSVGVVLGTPTSGSAEAVLQEASLAMLEAKRGGGGRYAVFQQPMKERAAHRAQLEADLRQGLGANELFVVYQPIVRLADRRCVGMEALVRWRHPARGIVPPIEFIEIAEQTGLIGAVGTFVLETACRDLTAWQRSLGVRAPDSVSVNVSRAQLADAAFVDQVHHLLHATGIAPACLQLEVTESLAAQDDAVQDRLQELRRLGVTLALDDFGTGYSSLACLHQLPVNVVKIDRSFVCQIESSAHHRVLIEAVVLVARSLGMGTVAEGIETEGQANELSRLRCDKGQGYLFARPLTLDDATHWLRNEVIAS